MNLLAQILLLFSVCLGGRLLALLLPVTFPASVLAMVLLLALLLCGAVKLEQISEIAGFLLKNMAILFIPSGVAILDSLGLIGGAALPLVFICLVTTVLTFGVTAWTVQAVSVLQERRKGGHDHGRDCA